MTSKKKRAVPTRLHGEAARYYHQALLDRSYAWAGFRDRDTPPTDATRICFSTQQAFEKLLKAMNLHYKTPPFDREHPLGILLENLAKQLGDDAVPEEFIAIVDFDPCAVKLRYNAEIPGFREVPMPKKQMIELMEDVFDWAEEIIETVRP